MTEEECQHLLHEVLRQRHEEILNTLDRRDPFPYFYALVRDDMVEKQVVRIHCYDSGETRIFSTTFGAPFSLDIYYLLGKVPRWGR